MYYYYDFYGKFSTDCQNNADINERRCDRLMTINLMAPRWLKVAIS